MADYEEYYEADYRTTNTENKSINDILIDISKKYPLAIPAATGLMTGIIFYAVCTSLISAGVFKGNLRTIAYLRRHPDILYKMV